MNCFCKLSTALSPPALVSKSLNHAQSSSSLFQLKRNLYRLFSKKPELRKVPDSIERPPYITLGGDVSPMRPEIKTAAHIDAMRPSCELAANILRYVGAQVKVSLKSFETFV